MVVFVWQDFTCRVASLRVVTEKLSLERKVTSEALRCTIGKQTQLRDPRAEGDRLATYVIAYHHKPQAPLASVPRSQRESRHAFLLRPVIEMGSIARTLP